MKRNTGWFENTFLESFNSRMETNQSVWVTEKQVYIFRLYMKERKHYDGFYYQTSEHQFTLHIMKKGYGRLTKELRSVAYI